MSDENMVMGAADETANARDDDRLRRAGIYQMAETDPSFEEDPVEWTPERQMMLAILEDAVACFRKTLKRPRQNPDILSRQAEFWIKLDDWNSPFSFNNICEALKLDPHATRELIFSSRGFAAAERAA